MKKICSIILTAVMSLSLVACGGGNKKESDYEAVIDKFIQAQADLDIRAILELLPPEVLSFVLESEGDAFLEESDIYLEDFRAYVTEYYGEDLKASYQIVTEENLFGEDLADIKEEYHEIGLDINIEAAKELELLVEYSGTKNTETDDLEVYIIRVDGEWYIDIETLEEMF